MSAENEGGGRMERLRAALEREPSSVRAHLDLAVLLRKVGRIDEAEELVRQALELDPRSYRAWVEMGGIRFTRFDFEGSLEAGKHAVAGRPGGVEGHYNLGLSYLYLNRPEEMLACFRRVVELDPAHPGGHYHVAVGLHAAGDVEGAKASLDRAQELGYTPQPDFLRAIDKELKKASKEAQKKALNNKNDGGGSLVIEIGQDPNETEEGGSNRPNTKE